MRGQQIKIRNGLLAFVFMLVCISRSFEVNANPVDSIEAVHMADQLLDSSVLIGIFECPGNTPLRHLKSGIVPEEQDKYLQTMLKNSLIKLNVASGSPDNFDSIIFVPMPSVNLVTDAPLQFMPYPDTRWILFLKTGFINGKPSEEWSSQLQLKDAEKYLNPGTVYCLADEYHGNACLAWNKNFEYQSQVPMASDNLINDFIEIRKILKNLPRGDSDAQKSERLAMLNKMVEKMKDPYGKAVGEVVKEKKM